MAMQLPVQDSWWSILLELASSLTFILALGACLAILVHALLTELKIQRKQQLLRSESDSSNSLPLSSDGSQQMGKIPSSRSGNLESIEDKIVDIHKTLVLLSSQTQSGDSHLLDVVKERSDFCYLSDVVPNNVEEIRAAVGDKMGKRMVFTAKKMGAQTIEANNNAGVAAANQIVGFFERGETRFALKA